MLQGARLQFRAQFRTMCLGGVWNIYRSAETISGVVLSPIEDCPERAPLLENVQAMSEQTMINKLSLAIRKEV